MKKSVLLGITASILSFATVSFANFSFHSSNEDACESISGQWIGTGKASNWFMGECVYHGSGTASPLDSQGHFNLTVLADKDSGSIFCPAHTTKELIGECVAGNVAFQTQYGFLKGNFSNNVGDAMGTLTVSPGINLDVAIQFQRIG
jgi:hypothetical protein